MKRAVAAFGLGVALSGAACAGVITGSGGAGRLSATDAPGLVLNPGGRGHILLVPYYSVQNGNATLLNIVNTDHINAKAVKVRFRSALNADTVFDFQVYIGPIEVWTANINMAPDGAARLQTSDNTCTLPADINRNFSIDRVPGTDDERRARTREGYVEIINMADIPPGEYAYGTTLYFQIRHRLDGSVGCRERFSELSAADVTTEAEAVAKGLDTPSGGLMANWTIINVPEASAWAGGANAIVAGEFVPPFATAVSKRGNLVWFPQTDVAPDAAALPAFTADPILRAGKVAASYADLPDLSTPYTAPAAAGAPELQASRLSDAMATRSVSNEYIVTPDVLAATDWVLTMPTRRYAVAVDYSAADATRRVIFNQGITVRGGSYATDSYFAIGEGRALQILPPPASLGPNTAGSGGNVSLGADGNAVCTVLPDGPNISWPSKLYNRSVRKPDGAYVMSLPFSVDLCGGANVLRFRSRTGASVSVLGSQLASMREINPWPLTSTLVLPEDYSAGWWELHARGNPSAANAAIVPGSSAGLPIIGQAFVKAANSAIGNAGANYGGNWDHRFIAPIER